MTGGPFGGRGEEEESPGHWGLFWIAIWTFFLIEPLSAGWDRRDTAAGWIGMVATLLFAVWYVAVFAYVRWGNRRSMDHLGRTDGGVALLGGLALALVCCFSVGQHGTATAVYLCVVCVMAFRSPQSLVLAAVNAAGFYAAGYLVPGWSPDNGLLLSMLTASLAVYGISQMIMGNIRLHRANEENKRLAVSDERNRFARDLHDILGHSLTVITVKAELAQRLLDVDPARAKAEVADLERLSRDALADVRRAVQGYREMSLPGELARARSALAAAGIEARLPNSADDVPSELRELYAWTVREGVTNVIRHSNATVCTVWIGPDGVEVSDDGRGPCDDSAGSGLLGLRERAGALGGTVITRALEPGFSLRVVAP